MDRKSPRGSAGNMLLSLEATLDEENKEVLATLDRRRSRSPIPPPGPRNESTTQYRSMLDVDPTIPRHSSIPGMGVSTANARDQRKSSTRLDPMDPSTWTAKAKPVSPSSTQTTLSTEQDAAPETAQGLPKIQIDSKQDFEQNYNFDMASMARTGGAPKPAQEKKPKDVPGGAAGGRQATKEIQQPQSIAAMLSPDSPKGQKKPRAASGSDIDDNRRRLSNKSSSFSTVTDDDEASSRVMADEEADEDALAESSSDDERRASSSDEESPDTARGRRRDADQEDKGEIKETVVERKTAPQALGVRSLIEPILSPSVPKESSGDVHPPSSFGRSGPTAADFVDEDEFDADLRKAKNLGTSISPVDSTIVDRHVRMIIRGEWSKFQDENENNHNITPRLYLACTDLSTEASYAMEWTVGTMMHDGDTLLAIYAIEDETAPKEPEGNAQVMTESAKAAQDTGEAMETLTRQTTNLESKTGFKFIPAIEAPNAADTNLAQMSKKEVERLKALDEITQSFLKLVRKTPLQVRCMIEVIHCKSPKHLMLNAIDDLEPTLCVVGTRGRSSLKGVLLGSFSNYLVMKSSVPVMVARRRLKKPSHAKVSIKMTNNLSGGVRSGKRRDLASARID